MVLITGAVAIGVGKAKVVGRSAEDTVSIAGKAFTGAGRITVVIKGRFAEGVVATMGVRLPSGGRGVMVDRVVEVVYPEPAGRAVKVGLEAKGLSLVIVMRGSSVSESQTVGMVSGCCTVPSGLSLTGKSAFTGFSCSRFLLCSEPSVRFTTYVYPGVPCGVLHLLRTVTGSLLQSVSSLLVLTFCFS